MNYRAVANYVALVLKLEATLMIIPMLISYYHEEHMGAWGFFASMVLLYFVSLCLDAVRIRNPNIYARDGMFVVAICWILVSVFGALPFWLSGAIPSFVDCLFESISGFSTTAASILTDVETLPLGLLFWRGFSLWIGGMGVLVLLMALMPMVSGGRSVHVFKAEIPGHAPGKLVPRLRQSSGILYAIYGGLTLLQVILLLCGGMPLFDSIFNAMVTTATGGFSITNASIAAYGSLYVEVVVIVFMVLSGVNYNIYYFLFTRNYQGIYRSGELKVYLGLFFIASLLVGGNLYLNFYHSLGASLREAFFHVGSILTTTGFTLSDTSVWPQFSKGILFVLMFLGACSGSTGGGVKISRVIIMWREVQHMLFRISHPKTVGSVKLDRKVVNPEVAYAVNIYVLLLLSIFCLSVLLVSFDNFDFETTLTAVAACLNNIGAGFGMVTHGSYAHFSAVSKLVLCLDMLLGRLEIFPIMLLFFPSTWKRA